MTEARLLAELQETRAELQRLRERVAAGTHTVHKDLSLVSLVLNGPVQSQESPWKSFSPV